MKFSLCIITENCYDNQLQNNLPFFLDEPLIDDIIVFTKKGEMQVVRVDSKVFVGKDIIHAAIFKRNDERTIYNMIYRDGKRGTSYIKRFAVKGITRDKMYVLTQGTDGSTVLYFTANLNGEAEVVNITLRNTGSIKKLKWDHCHMKLKWL